MTTLSAHIPTINLMPSARLAAMRKRSKVRLWIGVMSIYAVALGLTWGSLFIHSHSASRASEQLAQATELIKSKADELGKLRRASSAAGLQLAAAKAIENHPDWSILLQALAGVNGADIVLDRLDLRPRAVTAVPKPKPADKPGEHPAEQASTPGADMPGRDGYVLTLAGIAGTQTQVPEYANRLENLHVFDSVTISWTRQRDAGIKPGTGPQLFAFEIACVLTDFGPGAQAPTTTPPPPIAPGAGVTTKQGAP